MTCQHEIIQTFRTEDGHPVMWACASCKRKFEPATDITEKEWDFIEAQNDSFRQGAHYVYEILIGHHGC